MAEFQELLDLPPTPKLDLLGRLQPHLASDSELRGRELFFGKGSCGGCHPAPYDTDGLMHNVRVERSTRRKT